MSHILQLRRGLVLLLVLVLLALLPSHGRAEPELVQSITIPTPPAQPTKMNECNRLYTEWNAVIRQGSNEWLHQDCAFKSGKRGCAELKMKLDLMRVERNKQEKACHTAVTANRRREPRGGDKAKPNDGRGEKVFSAVGEVAGGAIGAGAGFAAGGGVGGALTAGAMGTAGAMAGRQSGETIGRGVDQHAENLKKSGYRPQSDPRYNPSTLQDLLDK